MALLDELPKTQWLLADAGYNAEWFRGALGEKGIKPCNPGLEIAQRAYQIRQTPLQAPQAHRDHVRSPEGLAPGRHTLRPLPDCILLRHRARHHRHLLALINGS